MNAQHGAAESLQPGPLEISEMLAAPYKRQGTRSWTGQTQTAGDPSKARLPEFGVSLFPRSFFSCLGRPLTEIFCCMRIVQKKT